MGDPGNDSSGSVGSSEELELAEIVGAFEDARRVGDPDATIDGWVTRHPAFESDLRELLPGLLLMESVAGDVSEAAARDAQVEAVPDVIGDYRILSRIGRGGMGVVYLAEQGSLGREVALKVLPTTVDLDRGFVARFQREAKAAGRLQHPHIVPVFGVGFADGRHFFAMRYIDGFSLDDILRAMRHEGSRDASGDSSTWGDIEEEIFEVKEAVRALKDPDGRLRRGFGLRAAVGIAAQVADAVEHAHGHGVLHRDIKPGNVLIDRDGMAWVADFGLCRMEDAGSLTSDGAILGTLRYMSPEQIEGAADERSDVYAVGLLLFELLTLRPAFDSVRRAKVVHDVLHTPLPRLRKLRPGVPRTLETIVQKASAKLPAERYPSAAALRRDLHAFLENRPIEARPPSAIYLARLFISRHRLATIVACLALAALGTLAAFYVRDLRASQEESERRAYVGDLAAAEAALRDGAIQRAKFHLGRAPEAHRSWEWAHLVARTDQSSAAARVTAGEARGLALHPDGTKVALGTSEGVVVATLPSLEVLSTLRIGPARTPAWDESGARLAVPMRDGTLRLFNTTDEGGLEPIASVRLPQTHRSEPRQVFFDGDTIIAGTLEGNLVRWEPAKEEVLIVEILSDTVVALGRFSGRHSASEPLDPGVRMWWAASRRGEVLLFRGTDCIDRYMLPLAGDAVTDLVIEDCFDDAICSTFGGNVYESSRRGSLLTMLYKSDSALEAVSVNGDTVVAAGRDKFLHVLSRRERQHLRSLSGVSHSVTDVACLPKSPVILTSSEDGVLRAWDRRVAGGGVELRGHLNDVNAVSFDAAGSRLVSGGRDGLVILWDVATTETLEVFTEPQAGLGAAAFLSHAPDGRRLESGRDSVFAGTTGGHLFLWVMDGETGWERRKHDLGDRWVRDAAYDPGSRTLFVATSKGIVAFDPGLERKFLESPVSGGDGAASKEPGTWRQGEDVGCLAVARGSLISCSRNGVLSRIEISSGRSIMERATGYPVGAMGLDVHLPGEVREALPPTSASSFEDGEQGVFVTLDFEAVVFDPQTGDVNLVLSNRTPEGDIGERLMGATFIGDGTRIMATTRNGLASIWDARDGEHLVDLRGHEYWAMRVCASPVTGWLASLSSDRTVRIWNTESTGHWAARLEEMEASRVKNPSATPAGPMITRRVILDRLARDLGRSRTGIPNHDWMMVASMYRKEPGDPEVAGLYAIARSRFDRSPDVYAILEASQAILEEEHPIQPLLENALSGLFDVVARVDALKGKASLTGPRAVRVRQLSPYEFGRRVQVTMIPYAPIMPVLMFASPVLPLIRAARALRSGWPL